MSTSDTNSIRGSLRTSAFLNRPQTAPMGPRTRKSRPNLVESLSDMHTQRSLSSTLDLHEFGGHFSSRPTSLTPSPSLSSSPSSPSAPSFTSDRMSLPAVSEEPKTTPDSVTLLDAVPAYEEEETLSISHSEDSSPKVVPVPQAPPKLVPPVGIKFESTPVPWKALPLEAALWTLDSNELQNIVARAIRSSEAFVRLLTLDNIDNVLPTELERLDTLKSVTQSKYRFLVQRRTMLFQALSSSLVGANHKDGEGTMVIGKLASQLTDTITECEKLSEELLSISDQTAQINKLIDIHLGSAFAIALRKLNGSLARRVAELAEANGRITQLEIDVQEAWKEAEKMAKELDDYETELTADDTEAIIEVAEIVPIQPSSPNHCKRPSTPMSPQLLSIGPPITASTSPKAPQSSLGPQFVFPPPLVHIKEKEIEAQDVPDTVSIRSSHSTRSASAKSIRGRGEELSRTSSVLAAKRRSHRASQSSLRLTTGHSRKQSGIRLKSPQEQPPVPELPLHFTDNVMPAPIASASSTLLPLDSRSSLRRRGSLDTVCTSRSPATSAAALAFRGRSADDMYVRPFNSSSSEIQLVPRCQTHNSTAPKYEVSIFETDTICGSSKDVIPVVAPSQSIPSMWMNVDALKARLSIPSSSPPAQAQSRLSPLEPESVLVHSNSMKTTYSRLKTLTKRYSASLPIFSPKSCQAGRPKSSHSVSLPIFGTKSCQAGRPKSSQERKPRPMSD